MSSPKRSERMRQRWADPEQRARMLAGAAKGHAAIAQKLVAGQNEPPAAPLPSPEQPAGTAASGAPSAAEPGSSGPAPSAGRSAGGILRSLFTSSPRDVLERSRGGHS